MRTLALFILSCCCGTLYGQGTGHSGYYAPHDNIRIDTAAMRANGPLCSGIWLQDHRFTIRYVDMAMLAPVFGREMSQGDEPVASGSWEPYEGTLDINCSYKQFNSGEQVAYAEHFDASNVEALRFRLDDGRVFYGAFSKRHYPDMPPLLWLSLDGGMALYNTQAWGQRTAFK